MTPKILLIQLWIGELPDYFWKHLITTEDIGVDFLLVTDQKVKIQYKNYKVLHKTKEDIIQIVNDKLGTNLNDIKNRNFTTLKPSLGYFFENFLDDYDYFGYYDIDLLFGDVATYLQPFYEKYDVISFGNEKTHNRISGPFTILRNTDFNRRLFLLKKNDLIHKLSFYDTDSFDEHEFDYIVKQNTSYKILFNVCNSNENNSKNSYECEWYGGKLYINNQEKMLFHFYDKKNTHIDLIGNRIITRHRKFIDNDFIWVTYFTESYEPILIGLIESIKKFSNMKCILYTINYDSNLRYKLGEQFIFRRLDIEKGETDNQGRDNNVLSLKPKILLDTLKFKPKNKFIYIDTDIYLTVNCDKLSNHFKKIDNYPLFNSHIHDKILANDIDESSEWLSPIDILSEVCDIPVTIFPRRKSNVILYDKNSEWFFEEQIEIYEKNKGKRKGIFRLHDEDSANILLSKYDLKESLPLIDMEESSVIDMEKFENYSYHLSNISEEVILPNHDNDVFVFHGFKDKNFYKEIENNYGKTVLDIEDFIISYDTNTIFFKKNNFLTDKKVKNEVTFKLYDKNDKVIYQLEKQMLFNYWTFYISGIDLMGKKIKIEIEEFDGGRIIYKNIKRF